jgi:hypothetical protein
MGRGAEPGDVGVDGHTLGMADRQMAMSVLIFMTISLYCAPLVLLALFHTWTRERIRAHTRYG